ncbi:hypothetical protein ADUPG1_001026 [Aduncisulcus paluster]|uniref:RsbT co-antagonist protein RsbRD N-terminal domain-containing protein n=1 Tax=Aduncisulcus paluster TaxID=2918883 RepID=A0ABQ5K9H0_9EUKA|nr:hypothetical protein ADUPG1_001026 [Aduncisulcus paluster]
MNCYFACLIPIVRHQSTPSEGALAASIWIMEPSPGVYALTRRTWADLDLVLSRIVAALRAEVSAYSPHGELSDDDIRDVLTVYLADVFHFLGGGPAVHSNAVDNAMRRQLDQGISVTDLLHSYRISASVIWDLLATQAKNNPTATDALINSPSGSIAFGSTPRASKSFDVRLAH